MFWFVFKTISAKSQQIFALFCRPCDMTSKTKIQFDEENKNVDVKINKNVTKNFQNCRFTMRDIKLQFFLNLDNLCSREKCQNIFKNNKEIVDMASSQQVNLEFEEKSKFLKRQSFNFTSIISLAFLKIT